MGNYWPRLFPLLLALSAFTFAVSAVTVWLVDDDDLAERVKLLEGIQGELVATNNDLVDRMERTVEVVSEHSRALTRMVEGSDG